MPKRAIHLLAGFVALTLPAAASSFLVNGSDSETSLAASVSYILNTIGNSTIGGSTGFTPATGLETLGTTAGITYSNYLSLLPSGSTLTGATLDFSGLFSSLTYSSQLTAGTLFYTPAFSSSLGSYSVKISSTLANTTLTGNALTGYNLFTLFSADILAGHALTIQWSVPDTFTANTSTYTNNCKNCAETLQVTNNASFTANSAVNVLNLQYTPPVAVPEPATLGFAGMALIGLGWVRRKRRQ